MIDEGFKKRNAELFYQIYFNKTEAEVLYKILTKFAYEDFYKFQNSLDEIVTIDKTTNEALILNPDKLFIHYKLLHAGIIIGYFAKRSSVYTINLLPFTTNTSIIDTLMMRKQYSEALLFKNYGNELFYIKEDVSIDAEQKNISTFDRLLLLHEKVNRFNVQDIIGLMNNKYNPRFRISRDEFFIWLNNVFDDTSLTNKDGKYLLNGFLELIDIINQVAEILDQHKSDAVFVSSVFYYLIGYFSEGTDTLKYLISYVQAISVNLETFTRLVNNEEFANRITQELIDFGTLFAVNVNQILDLENANKILELVLFNSGEQEIFELPGYR